MPVLIAPLTLLALLTMGLAFRGSGAGRRISTFFALSALMAVLGLQGWGIVTRTLPSHKARAAHRRRVPRESDAAGFVTSNKCHACHPDHHASWHRTYHRTMTQLAVPGCVAGEFAGQTIKSDGLPYTVYRRGDQFWARMPDPEEMMNIAMGKPMEHRDVPLVDRQVLMTTGSHHYQTYWVAGAPEFGNLMQTLPLVYLINDERWIPREAAFLMAPDSPRMITQWNHHCIKCHSTGGNPGLLRDVARGRFETQIGELGISCEACHGPGEEHIRVHQNVWKRYAQHLSSGPDETIVNPDRLDHVRSTELCGQCHGSYLHRRGSAMRYAASGVLYRAGDDLHEHRLYTDHPLRSPSELNWEAFRRNRQYFRDRYWDDGTMLVGGREYTALRVSKCFTEGEISCLSCHSMHQSDPKDQLKPGMRTNEACTQCHDDPEFTTAISDHTHHTGDSEGSSCLNCHMPHNAYALFSGIRNHQIETPRVAASIRYGVPNACNLCHLDKTLAWSQSHMYEWYHQPLQTLTAEQETYSAALLWLLKGNAAQRVVTAWHVGWAPAQQASGPHWLAPATAGLLADPYGVVRYVAAKSLRSLPGFEGFEFDFLADPDVRARAVEEAMQRWASSESPQQAQQEEALLMSDQGTLRRDVYDRLLRERDDTPMNIQE